MTMAGVLTFYIFFSSQAPLKPPENLVAYNKYIHARSAMAKYTAEGFVEARQPLERAVAYRGKRMF